MLNIFPYNTLVIVPLWQDVSNFRNVFIDTVSLKSGDPIFQFLYVAINI